MPELIWASHGISYITQQEIVDHKVHIIRRTMSNHRINTISPTLTVIYSIPLSFISYFIVLQT